MFQKAFFHVYVCADRSFLMICLRFLVICFFRFSLILLFLLISLTFLVHFGFKKQFGYDVSIKYYSKVLLQLTPESLIYADILYQRGGSFERIGEYKCHFSSKLMCLAMSQSFCHFIVTCHETQALKYEIQKYSKILLFIIGNLNCYKKYHGSLLSK